MAKKQRIKLQDTFLAPLEPYEDPNKVQKIREFIKKKTSEDKTEIVLQAIYQAASEFKALQEWQNRTKIQTVLNEISNVTFNLKLLLEELYGANYLEFELKRDIVTSEYIMEHISILMKFQSNIKKVANKFSSPKGRSYNIARTQFIAKLANIWKQNTGKEPTVPCREIKIDNLMKLTIFTECCKKEIDISTVRSADPGTCPLCGKNSSYLHIYTDNKKSDETFQNQSWAETIEAIVDVNDRHDESTSREYCGDFFDFVDICLSGLDDSWIISNRRKGDSMRDGLENYKINLESGII